MLIEQRECDVDMSSVTDRNGLVKDGGYLVVFNPVVQSGKDPVNSSISIRYNKAMVFKVLARQIEDRPDNTTRFFVIGRELFHGKA